MKRISKKDFKKKAAAFLAIFLALLMLLSAIAPFIFADSMGASISGEIGYSGLYKVGYPVPAKLNISAGSYGFSGEALIRIPIHDSTYRGETQYISYAYPLTLNPGENRAIKMDISINTIVANNQLKAELIDSKGKSIAESTLETTAFNPENLMVGFLSDNPDNLSYIKANFAQTIMKDYSSQRTVNFTQSNFPESIEALNSFDAIFINDFDVNRLTNNSREALKNWVFSGGMLFVGTGENYQKTIGSIETVVDIENMDRTSDSHKSSDAGLGRVIVFDFDIGNSAVSKDSAAIDSINEIIINEISEKVNRLMHSMMSRGQSNYIVYPYNLNNIPNQNTIVINLIFILILLYILACGPVLYIFLRKKDRKEAGFVIVPCVSLGVTILIFLMSINTVFKRPLANEVSKLYISNGQSSAMKNGNVAILSAKKGDILAEIKDNTDLIPFLDNNYGYSYYSYNNYKPIKVLFGDNSSIQYSDNERWDTNIFGISQEIDIGGTITVEMSIVNGIYEGIIMNDTPHELKNVIISFGNKGHKILGNIGAWEEFPVSESFDSEKELGLDIYSLLMGENQNLHRVKSDAEELELWHKSMYRLMLDSEINNYNSYSYYSSSRPYAVSAVSSSGIIQQRGATDIRLYAFINKPLGSLDLDVNGLTPLMYHNNLLIMDVECNLAIDENYDIPFGYISVTQIRSQGNYDANINYGVYTYDTDEIEFIFDLSKFENLQSFQFSEDFKQNDRGETINAEIYNVRSKSWEELLYTNYNNVNRYLDSEGKLTIRVNTSNTSHVYYPEISVKGGAK